MITLRPAESRGRFDFGWLDTHHTFSFGNYFDPEQTQFRSLRVLNEDRVQPGKGFGTHGHRDMEILTWVLSGALEHRDSLGTHGVIRPGEAQIMSAGTGIRHSEFNASATEPVHFLQIWLLPERAGLPPRYDQAALPSSEATGRWRLLASPDARDGSLRIFQDALVWSARLEAGQSLEAPLPAGRYGYLHVAMGAATAAGQRLGAGDALKFTDEAAPTLRAEAAAEVIFFDLA